jgi:predicted Zn-dependent protease
MKRGQRLRREAAHPGAAALVAALALLAAGAGCRTNPVTGGSELNLISPQKELALGHQNHPDIVFMYDGEYYDPDLNRYLGTIVWRLHRDSHRPEMPTEFTMLNTSVLNAFATPGHVYATRGFLARLENEAQFAAVMGHELAHVTAGHSAKQLSNALVTGLVVNLADTAAGESLGGRVAVGLGQASVTLLGLSYSREQEIQADRVGTYYMALGGWDPRQAVAMQQLLVSLGKRKETVLDRYLATHPPSANRVREIEAVIQEKNLASARYVQGDGVYADRWGRHVARLREVDRAFVPHDRGQKLLANKDYAGALAAAEEALAIRDDQAQFHRLRGDALLRLGRTADAKAAYQVALARDARYVPANVGLGLTLLEEGRYEAAQTQFAIAVHGYPSSLPARYGLGLSLYRLGRHREAIPPLEAVVSSAADSPEPRYFLAVCYDRTGQQAAAYSQYQQAVSLGLQEPERSDARRRVAELAPAYGVTAP